MHRARIGEGAIRGRRSQSALGSAWKAEASRLGAGWKDQERRGGVGTIESRTRIGSREEEGWGRRGEEETWGGSGGWSFKIARAAGSRRNRTGDSWWRLSGNGWRRAKASKPGVQIGVSRRTGKYGESSSGSRKQWISPDRRERWERAGGGDRLEQLDIRAWK